MNRTSRHFIVKVLGVIVVFLLVYLAFFNFINFESLANASGAVGVASAAGASGAVGVASAADEPVALAVIPTPASAGTMSAMHEDVNTFFNIYYLDEYNKLQNEKSTLQQNVNSVIQQKSNIEKEINRYIGYINDNKKSIQDLTTKISTGKVNPIEAKLQMQKLSDANNMHTNVINSLNQRLNEITTNMNNPPYTQSTNRLNDVNYLLDYMSKNVKSIPLSPKPTPKV